MTEKSRKLLLNASLILAAIGGLMALIVILFSGNTYGESTSAIITLGSLLLIVSILVIFVLRKK